MPKYLIQGSYSGEGLKGLLKEGGSKRREAAEQSVKGLGGRLEAFYYAFGNDPIEKDALNGPFPTEILARVAARMGEPDRAIAVLQELLSIQYSGTLAANAPLTPALLRLDPMFDPLRSDPRFEKLVADHEK